MKPHHSTIKVLSGNSNPELAEDIAARLSVPLCDANISRFSDGEISVQLKETVRGFDVFIVQSTCAPVDSHLMELLIMIDACRRASAGRITAVIPYYGYARQDRKVNPRDPITAKLVANLIGAAGAQRVLTMDLHASQIQAYFDIPVDELVGAPIIAAHYLERRFDGDDLVVVSPDLGSVTRARNFASRLNSPMAIIDKRRPKANVSEIMNIIGDVKGKRALLVDDMIDTAGTICNAAQALVEKGATDVYACCTHGVLSGAALERIDKSPIKELVCTNTIPLPDGGPHSKLRTISIAGAFAMAIERIYEEQPISDLFK